MAYIPYKHSPSEWIEHSCRRDLPNGNDEFNWTLLQKYQIEFIESIYNKYGYYPEDEEVVFVSDEYHHCFNFYRSFRDPNFDKAMEEWNALEESRKAEIERRKLAEDQTRTQARVDKDNAKLKNIENVIKSNKLFVDKLEIMDQFSILI